MRTHFLPCFLLSSQAQEMADVLIDHLNKQPQGLDHRNREMFEWLEKRDFYDYEVNFTFRLEGVPLYARI